MLADHASGLEGRPLWVTFARYGGEQKVHQYPLWFKSGKQKSEC
jgi:hypothetical protein